MIKYSDYKSTTTPKVVVEGSLIEYSNEALDCLAQNAMLLALGADRQRILGAHSEAALAPATYAGR